MVSRRTLPEGTMLTMLTVIVLGELQEVSGQINDFKEEMEKEPWRARRLTPPRDVCVV